MRQIITTHKSTDFDALASLIAGTLLYPNAVPVLPRSLNPNVKVFLSIHKDIFNTKEPRDIDLDQVEKLIVVESPNAPRLQRQQKR